MSRGRGARNGGWMALFECRERERESTTFNTADVNTVGRSRKVRQARRDD